MVYSSKCLELIYKSQEAEGLMIRYQIFSDHKLSTRNYIEEEKRAGYLYLNSETSNQSTNMKKVRLTNRKMRWKHQTKYLML